MSDYLKGNYVLSGTITPDPDLTIEEQHTQMFEALCKKMQAKLAGLGGSVPYVKIRRVGQGAFVRRDDDTHG